MYLTLTNIHATELPNGVYRVYRNCLLTHFRGKGDGRVRVEMKSVRAGQTLAYTSTPANGYWWGIELATVEQIHGEQRAKAIEQVADPGEVRAACPPHSDGYNSRIEDVAKMIREAEVVI
jgi:hypothetical protein